MERFVNNFSRDTNRTASRSGFRVSSIKPATTVNTEDKEPEKTIVQPVEEADTVPEVGVNESIEATVIEPVNVQAKLDVEENAEVSAECDTKAFSSFDDFLKTIPCELIDDSVHEIDTEEPKETPQSFTSAPIPEAATSTECSEECHTESEFEAAKKTIDMLTQAIVEKDEYIAKLKEYAQVTDDELKLAKEQNKTLLEVTGKFVMKF